MDASREQTPAESRQNPPAAASRPPDASPMRSLPGILDESPTPGPADRLESDDGPEIPLDDAGRIAADVSCLQCGYNLRTLLPAATCPECGAPVLDSMHSELLRNHHWSWVQDTAERLDMLLMCLAFLLCTGLLMVVGRFVGRATFLTLFYHLGWVLTLIAGSCFAIGLTFLLAQVAAEPRSIRSGQARKTLFWAAGAAVGTPLLLWVTPAEIWWAATIVAAYGLLVALVGYVARLVERVPDARLAGRLRAAVWGFVPSVTLLAAGEFGYFLAFARNWVQAWVIAGETLILLGALAGIGAGWWLLLQLRAGVRALRGSAAEAGERFDRSLFPPARG